MNIIRPPFTGNAEIDSWTNQITQALNMGLLLPGVQGQSGEGAAGPSGNTAIYLYQRTTDNTAPSRPTSVVYDYTDIENVTITANNGWVGEVPTSSGKYLWITFRYVSNLQDTITNANTWNTVVLLSEDGDDGGTGLTGASTNIIFIRSSSAPSTPTASSGVPATWYDSPPAGTELLWASSGLKAISSTTFTWSTPFQIEGEAIVEVSIYRKNSAVFSTGGSYNFVTQTLTPPTDWLTEPPSLTSNNDVIYRISGVASGSSTQTAATVSYGSPVTYAQRTDGSNGYNSARVLLHKKYTSATLPGAQLFSGTFTYTFSTGALSGGTLNGWSQTAPSLSAGEFLFTSEALAYAAETTVDIPTSSFTTPQITGIAGTDGTNGTNGTDGTNGAAGTDGLNNATVFLYNKNSSATAPSLFSGTFTYTFSTGVLSSGTLNEPRR